MSRLKHRLYIYSMVLITVMVTVFLAYTGYSYYNTPIPERFFHPRHNWFKPSGFFGHGLGIIGTLLMTIGVVIYIARKRYNFLARFIRLKYLLEFHIFLCTLGPIMILFHTSFKFGGMVSVAFWSMVAVVLSGVVGRFIYIQIPRTIEGRALNLEEIYKLKARIKKTLIEKYSISDDTLKVAQAAEGFVGQYLNEKRYLRRLKELLRLKKLNKKDYSDVVQLYRDELRLSGRLVRLQKMQKLFQYWHVAHLPFAIIMLAIVLAHIIITVLFGYTWIF